MGFLGGSDSKESSCNTGDLGSIPGLGRSPGEGNSYPLQYTGLENSRDCIVHGVTKSQTWLSFTQMLFTHKQKIICGTIWRNVDGTASDSDTRDYLLYNNYFGNKYLNLRLPALFSSVQFSRSVHVWLFATLWTLWTQSLSSCLTLCNPMNCSTPGLPVHHQLPEFTQSHVHWVSDAIQPSHPLLSPFPPAPNPSQHQGLLKWVSSLHQVAKVLEFQLQHQSFQWTPRTDLL